MTLPARPVGAVFVAALVATLATACSSASDGPAASTSATGAVAAPAPGAAVTRWWSDPAADSGSAIDPAHPTAAAAHLRPSRKDYCAVLAATVHAGRSLVPGTSSAANVTATRAFVAEVQHLAPTEVAPAWQVLGPAVLRIATSASSAGNGESVSIRSAVVTIARDAKTRCGVDLAG